MPEGWAELGARVAVRLSPSPRVRRAVEAAAPAQPTPGDLALLAAVDLAAAALVAYRRAVALRAVEGERSGLELTPELEALADRALDRS